MNKKIGAIIRKLRKKFAEEVKNAPPHDYYSYWPGDETRPCVHAFQTNKQLKPYCLTCGEEINKGIHLRNRDTHKEYDYTLSRDK